jgi:hypothetical protein
MLLTAGWRILLNATETPGDESPLRCFRITTAMLRPLHGFDLAETLRPASSA